MDAPHPVLASLGDFAFYSLIYDFLRDEIRQFGISLLSRTTAWIGGMALSLMTLWVMLQGYLIASGQSRESLTTLIAGMLRATVIVSVASAMSVGGTQLHQFLTKDLNAEIHHVVTGESGNASVSIDRSLAYMQIAMSGIDAIQSQGDTEIESQKARAVFMAGLGTAGPAMSAAAMLLLYEIAMALFVGFGPIFIMSLLFKSTASLFQKWLYYGLGTLFSLAVLSFVIDIAMRMTIAVAQAFWVARFAGSVGGILFEEGISSQALQQGGLGLLLTVLIVSAPPMAAMFFYGALGNFMPGNAFSSAKPNLLQSNHQPGTR